MSVNGKNTTWRDRLLEAIKASGRSQRSLSLAANLGAGAVNSWFTEGKEPSVANFIAVAQELNVSVSWLLYGINISRETEELLQLLESQPDARDGILQVLRAKAST